MNHILRCLPLALAAFALHAQAQSLSPAWDEYRKDGTPAPTAQPQTQTQAQAQAQPTAVTAPAPAYQPTPARSRDLNADDGGFFIGAQVGQGWIYEDVEQDAVAISAGYRWQAGPWTQVGVEVSTGRLDSTDYDIYEIPKATYRAIGANARFNFGDSPWFATVRGGYFNADQDDLDGGDFSTDGGYAGIGIGVDVNRHFNVTLGYTAFVYADDYTYDACEDDFDDCDFSRADTVMLGIEGRF